jgi:hypothetical protein
VSATGQSLLIVALASAAEGWAFGAQGAILRYANGTWSLYHGD